MSEKWADIEGFEGCYQVSDKGRVRSLDRVLTTSKGVRRSFKGQILKTHINSINYEGIKLGYKGKEKFLLIHILIATYFIPNPENKPQVNHIDGNPSNNFISNLEWVTGSENMIHAYRTGLQKPVYGDNNPKTRITELEVSKIRHLCREGIMKQYEIAKMFNISNSHVSMIKNNKNRKNG